MVHPPQARAQGAGCCVDQQTYKIGCRAIFVDKIATLAGPTLRLVVRRELRVELDICAVIGSNKERAGRAGNATRLALLRFANPPSEG